MGKHRLARARFLIGVYHEIRKNEEPDGNKLHDLHAAIKLHFDHIGKLRERGSRKQRAAECGQNGQSGNAERVAEELAESQVWLAPSLFHQLAAQTHRCERRHHDAAGHREQQAEERGLQNAERCKAQHADHQKDRAPARADTEEEVKEQHKQRRRTDALNKSQCCGRCFQFHRRHRAARVAERRKARIKV